MGARASVPKQTKEDEAMALESLKLINDGTRCLSGNEHSWWQHDGQFGSGRGCERCFMSHDSKGNVVFKIQPRLPESSATPTATAILARWREELKRCQDGGCVAGGEHAWIDVRQTLMRLTGEGRCCERCGLVMSASESGDVLCLPNMIGKFGPSIPKEYRGMYGGEASGNVPPPSLVGALSAAPRDLRSGA